MIEKSDLDKEVRSPGATVTPAVHRTVAFHLRNVFAKTGVASRGELAQLDLS
ncbi:MAG: hypothetical protein QOI16_1056 [Pseudonocardiales bacterium]|jgi:hypothetical protein|nr:hypothetical protein [Pseudonocardiales bacterium]